MFQKKNKRQSSNERESHSTKLASIENQSAQYNSSHKTDPLLPSSEDDATLRSVVIVPSSNPSTSKPDAGHANNSHKRHR